MTALEINFRKYYTPMCAIAAKYIPKEDVHDIVIDSLIKFADKEVERAILYKTLQNACIDYLRTDERHTKAHKEILYLCKDEDYMMEADVTTHLFEIFRRLSKRERQVLILKLQGKEYFEIAAVIKVASRTIINTHTNAMRKLKDFFGTQNNVIAKSRRQVREKRAGRSSPLRLSNQ